MNVWTRVVAMGMENKGKVGKTHCLEVSECERKEQRWFQEQWKNWVGKMESGLRVVKILDLVMNTLLGLIDLPSSALPQDLSLKLKPFLTHQSTCSSFPALSFPHSSIQKAQAFEHHLSISLSLWLIVISIFKKACCWRPFLPRGQNQMLSNRQSDVFNCFSSHYTSSETMKLIASEGGYPGATTFKHLEIFF